MKTAFRLFLITAFFLPIVSFCQNCNNWLRLPSQPSFVRIGDLDIPGNKVTVEAIFNRTAQWTGADVFQGDLVSKHEDQRDCNYLLRPSSAEITTTNGYFKTPVICPIQLNKTYHAALVYDGTTLKFYRNGFLMSQIAASGNLIQNNWQTQIGLYFNQITQENFLGYINEVRIWNIARTQNEIRTYLNQPLPSPSTQTGLLAYYTFDNLLNKQGNATWNGTLNGNASFNQTNPDCNLLIDSCSILQTNVIPNFIAPDTVCVNTPVNITNTSSGASSYFWNFCVADVNTPPMGVNLGNPGSFLSQPVFMDMAEDNGSYYGFVVNHFPGGITRLDFGSSLLNNPTPVFLGNISNALNSGYGSEGIQIVKANGKWYGIVVGGNPTSPGSTVRLVIISFGANLNNPAPTAIDYGNLGNMLQSIDLHVFQENGIWYGFTVNAENNTITRFNFTNSFDNPPTAVNLGNIGSLNYPTGVYALNDNGFWRVFVTNGNSSNPTITRLDFGNSLLNNPIGVNLGNPGNQLVNPRDITILRYCGQNIGFVANANNSIIRLNFGSLTGTPTATNLGNIGTLNFSHSLSKLFRVGNDIYSFITNVGNNTITRLAFLGCTSSSTPSSSAQNPPPVIYNSPGIYNINLSIDDGLPSQTAFCKQVVVLANPVHSPTQSFNVCPGGNIKIGSSLHPATYLWNTGATADSINVSTPGTYWVETNRYGCSVRDSFIVNASAGIPAQIFNADTIMYAGDVVQLNSFSPSGFYSWTPATGLNCFNCSHPMASPQVSTTYVLTGSNSCGTSKDSVRINIITRATSPCSGFQLALGTPVFDRGYDVVPSLNNEFFVVGVTRVNGNDDILIAKMDLGGAIIWSKTFGGSNTESVRKISATSDGGVLITGQTKSFVGNGEILCLKISNAGNLVWSKRYGLGSTYGDLGMDIIETTDGGYAVSGIINVNGGVADAFLLKLNSTLNIVWAKRFDRNGDGEDGVGVVQKGDTLIFAADLQNGTGNYTMALTKLRMGDGSIISAKQLTPAARGIFNSYLFKNPAQPGYIISGHTIDAFDYSNMKQVIITVNDNLDIVNTKLVSLTPVTNDFFTGFVPLADGSFIGCASPQSNADGYVYRIGANNTVSYAKKFNGTADRRLYRLAVTGTDVIAIGGTIVNGQEDIFLTNFKTDATLDRNCEIQDVSISVQQPAYSASNMTWSNMSNAGFPDNNTAWNPITTNLLKTDICPKPVFDFGFQQNMCSPKTVQFTASLPGVSSFQWDFGNGQTNNTSQTPSTTYSGYGTYPVKLIVQNTGGCPDSLVKTILLDNVFDNNLVLNKDTTICLGDSILLKANNTALNYCWQASSGTGPSLMNAYVKPTSTTVYTLTAQLTGINLVGNGNFSGGNTGFVSDYTYAFPNLAEGQYWVGSNPASWNGGVSNCGDHSSGTGNMLNVNGSPVAKAKIWSQTVTVLPNTNYNFSVWIASLSSANPANLQFSINNVPLGNSILANSFTCQWLQFSSAWNSGNNTTATITVINNNTVAAGNDFVLDDIFFGQVTTVTDSVTVSINGLCDSIKLSGANKICSRTDTVNYSIYKPSNCTQQYFIQVDNAYADIIAQTPTSVKLAFKKNGITRIKVWYDNPCRFIADSLDVSIQFSPTSIDLGPDISVCRDTSFTLHAGSGFSTYLWQGGSTDSTFQVSAFGTYNISTQNLCGVQFTDTMRLIKSIAVPFAVDPVSAVVCQSDSVRFTATGGSVYAWSPATNFSQPNANTSKAWVNANQTFTVSISDPACLRDTTISIPVIALTEASIHVTKSNDVNCSNDSAILIADGGISYTWSPQVYITRTSNGKITVRPPQTTTYYVQGKNASGCTGTDSVTVSFIREGDQKLFVPDAFSPNGDGLNEVFRPVFTGPAARYVFSIYNRWGQLIFQSNTPGVGWNGKYRSTLQPKDVYVYYIIAEGGCNGKFEQKGTFVLIR